MTGKLRTLLLVLTLSLSACGQSEPPPRPPVSAEARALWNAIPENEKREHGMSFHPGPRFVMVADFRSAAVDTGFPYWLSVVEMAQHPNRKYDARANWEAVQNLNFSEMRDECGYPSAIASRQFSLEFVVHEIHVGPDDRISQVGPDVFISCSSRERIGCRAHMRRERFIVNTVIDRDRLCEWPALQQEIDAALKVWFPELEASNFQ